MEVEVNSADKIVELKQSSAKTNPNDTHRSTYRTSYATSSSKSSSRTDFKLQDTVHYMSLATTPALTECEGDMPYQHFLTMHDNLIPAQVAYSTSSKSSSSISCYESKLQRTLAIIKPDAMKYKDVVLRAVREAGMKVINRRTLQLTPEQVSEVYQKFYGNSCFPHMVVALSMAPVMVLSLAGKNCIDKWKTMIGPYGWLREEWFFPYSVRTRYGILPEIPEVLHASETPIDAKKETRYFFPRSILEPIPAEEDKVSDYITLYIKETLLRGLMELVRTKPVDPILYLAEWLLLNNPYQPKFPERVALSPL